MKLQNLFLSLLAVVCFVRADRVQAEAREIKLGGIFDVSSAAGSVWGKAEQNGFKLAVADFEKANPEIKIKYSLEDSAYVNSVGVTALHKLISNDGFKYIVGPTWETFVATSPICEQKKIICLAPSNNGSIFHTPNRPLNYSFTAFFDERGYTKVLAERMKQAGVKRVAAYTAITDYFDVLNQSFLDNFEHKPAVLEHVGSDARDFRSMITKAPQDIDALLLLLDGNGQSLAFLKTWTQLRKDRPTIYSHDGIMYETEWEQIKKMGFKLLISEPELEAEADRRWISKYQAAYQVAPEAPSASIAYDLTTLLLQCLANQAGADDTAAVRDCLRGTENYQGFSGLLSFKGGQTVESRSFKISEF